MNELNRRQFLDRSSKSVVQVAAGATIFGNAASASAGQSTGMKRPEVVVVYYPHWHNYDHGSTWKGEGWTEWEGVKAAIPRFPGHHQPIKPTWGYFDESDPKWTAREIDLAADHGIDVFLYDWYWYSGVKTMQEALEQGFLKAPNRDRMKFAIMWANHDRRDQFCPDFNKERTIWMTSRHSPRDWERVMDYCTEHYFRQPNYWRVDGGLYFNIYLAPRFIKELGGPAKTRKLLEKTNNRLAKANLPPLHLAGMVSHPKYVAELEQAGFSSTSRYNVNRGTKPPVDLKVEYDDVMEAHRAHWQRMKASSLPDMPVVTTGWDVTPRCRPDVPWPFPNPPYQDYPAYPYCHLVVGSTPEKFEQLLGDVAKFVKDQKAPKPVGVLINAWNEWTEGCYLLPEERTGTARLEAIKRTFGMAKR